MSQRQAAPLAFSASEIVASVRSLYADALKPFGRVLLRRLRERAAARAAAAQQLPEDAVDPESMPRVNPRHLQKICEKCRQLVVAPEEGKEYSVALVNQPDSFLDVCSPVDPYPTEFWLALSSYLDDLTSGDMMLPGGRYACARVLAGRQLPIFQGRSLGQICHIVQIAISQRRLLGYREGCLVPYRHSENWVKEQCAVAQSPTGNESCPVVTWEDAPSLLRHLLSSHRQAEPGGISISNLKRLFRLEFQRELSQTVLGHVRLLDLLSDARLNTVCTLNAQPNGQVLVRGVEDSSPRWSPVVPPGMWVSFPSMTPVAFIPLAEQGMIPIFQEEQHDKDLSGFCTDSTAVDSVESDCASDAGTARCSTASQGISQESSDDENGVLEWAVSVKNTFITVPVDDPNFPRRCSRHRRRSVPAHLGSRAMI